MKSQFRILCALVLLGQLALPLTAQFAQGADQVTAPTQTIAPKPSFDDWLEGFRTEALAQGIREETLDKALKNIEENDTVVRLDKVQPETSKKMTLMRYMGERLTTSRIQKGREFYVTHQDILKKLEETYGVAPEIILALWGMESNFGENTGNFNVVESLATLAYEGRRAAFFRKELLMTLQMIERTGLESQWITGSWAGAMGQCQFMPSTYMKYAVAFDGQSVPDIWNNTADVMASMAHYLSVGEKWKAGGTWGQEVRLEKPLMDTEIGLDKPHSLDEWYALGVRGIKNYDRRDKNEEAYIIQPDGARGKSFLVYANFKSILGWNRSTYFAITVGSLADKIVAAPSP